MEFDLEDVVAQSSIAACSVCACILRQLELDTCALLRGKYEFQICGMGEENKREPLQK